MNFYTKCLIQQPNDLYKYLWLTKFTISLLFIGIIQTTARTVKEDWVKHTAQFTKAQDSVIYKGRVTDQKGRPLPGATVKILGQDRMTSTSTAGDFSIYAPAKAILSITYIGYQEKNFTLSGTNPSEIINIQLVPGQNLLGDVSVVSNGIEDLQKERTTGSYEVITKEQLFHSSDPNLIKRLEGITTAMDFSNTTLRVNSANAGNTTLNGQFNNSPLANLTIRGKNTFSKTNTTTDNNGLILVVIDGVPSPYSVDNVNPNDVESLTILKDASAAAIWGSRAANGVIVIKTKKGDYQKPLSVSFNSNFNFSEKLDPFYKRTMSTSEFVDAQIFQFNAANTSIGAANVVQPQPFYSPVAEILNQQKQGLILPAQATAQLETLRGNDVRKDFDKYLFREAFTQSYSLGIDGGGKNMTYRLSGNYDNTRNNTILSGGDRLSVTYNTSIKPLKNLELTANINFTQRTNKNQAAEDLVTGAVGNPFFLYTRLADDQGIPLKIPYKYRPAFVDLMATTYGANILSLDYTPLQNINEGYAKTEARSVNINLGASYKLNSILSAQVLYNYNRARSEQNILNKQNSFYMRDLITQYTAPSDYRDPLMGPQPFLKQIPLGGLYSPTSNIGINQFVRGYLTANKSWNTIHEIHGSVGVEIAQNDLTTQSDQYYGYDDIRLLTSFQNNYLGLVTPLYLNLSGASTLRIPYMSGFGYYKSRSYGLYSNASYTYNRKYILTASIRKDVSSEFGDVNHRGATPFYSIGSKWNIGGENFYTSTVLPVLQLRANFGTTGSVGSRINGMQSISLPVTAISLNNLMQPDRTQLFNVGLDFGFRNNSVSGSVEFYNKNSTDHFINSSIDPVSGRFDPTTINSGKIRSRGIDLRINSQNLHYGLFSWTSVFLMSYNRTKIERSPNSSLSTASLSITDPLNYTSNSDLNGISAFRWAGLDPANGNPRGYVSGVPTIINDLSSFTLVANQSASTARSFGSAVPVYFGSFRNTVNYGSFSLSANLLYKLGYYFRRPVSDLVQYNDLFNNGAVQGEEFNRRWQKSGDEQFTNIPSMVYPGNTQRDQFYRFSEINVLKGDHLRLQEINLSYSVTNRNWFLKNVRLYANITNLGIIWRSNNLGIDPDLYDYPNPRTYAVGLSAKF